MTLNEKIETNANIVLWCVHVLGPDDVLPAPTHEAAVAWAKQMNETLFRRLTAPYDDVLAFAHAAPWPHSKESHAELLANESDD